MDVIVVNLPPRSPDLNISEHYWGPLKREVMRLHPEFRTMQATYEAKQDALRAALREAHDKFRENRDHVSNMVEGYRRRGM
jgi:hypothetical protein